MLISGKDANGDIIPVLVDANGVVSTSGGGGGGAVTVADGADVAEGATTDAANTTGAAGTISGKLRGLVTIFADVWNSSLHFLRVGGATAVGAPPGTNPVSVAGWDGVNKQHILTDTAGRTQIVGAAAAGTAVAGNPVRVGISDGTNAQDWRQVAAGAGSITGGVGMGAVGLYLNQNTGWNPLVCVQQTSADSSLLSSALPVATWDYNGTTLPWDRHRNNVDVTLLASAARTTTQTSADIITYNAHSLIVTLDMTVVGTGSVTLAINYKDPASGKYIPLLTGLAVTTNSTNMYTVNRHIPAVANVNAQKDLGRIIQIVVTANNANPATYSVGYTLVC